jgi:uncharacterized membrane protein
MTLQDFLTHPLGPFTPLDVAALAFLLISWVWIGWRIENPPTGNPSVSVLMVGYRREWMRQFITRQPRIFDAGIMDSLRQGTTFFASACMIAIGSGAALLGNTERLAGLANDLALGQAPELLWEAKLLTVLMFVTNGFLKFVWSHRLFGYCAITMASVPNDVADPLTPHRAQQAAELNIAAAKSYNRGLRAIYFALGTLPWLLGAVPLILATCFTLAVLWRREFGSGSRRVLMQNPPE